MVHDISTARIQLRRDSGCREPAAVVGRETSRRSRLEVRVAESPVSAMPSAALAPHELPLSHEWRGPVGMWCLIAAESTIFCIFVVAYLYYAGKSLGGPMPNDVLHTPVLGSICLFTSSVTIVMAERAIGRGQRRQFGTWLF